MECTMLGGARQDGATRKRRGVWAIYNTSPSSFSIALDLSIPLYIFALYLSSL